MKLDNDLQDALTYLDEAQRKEALAYLEAAKDSPAEFALRRKGILAEAEDSPRLGALRVARFQHQNAQFRKSAKPSTT